MNNRIDFFKFEAERKSADMHMMLRSKTDLMPFSRPPKHIFSFRPPNLKGTGRPFFYRIRFVLACLSVSLSPLFSQPYLFDLREVNVQDGLPHRRAFAVTQDQDGFIWVNTPGAISRYDGYRFKTYNASFLKISENNSVFLAADKNNNLWYCEKTGIENPNQSGIINTRQDTVYDFETFTHGLFSSEDVIRISQSRINKSELFISTRQGIIYKYNGAFEEVYRMSGKIQNYVICEALPDSSYWILHARTMARVKNGRLLDSFDIEPPGLFQFTAHHPDIIVETRYQEYPSNYWVLQNRQLIPFHLENYPPEEITALFQIHNDYTCFATPEAIVIQDQAGNQLLNYPVSRASGRIENQRYYNGAFAGRQNILWIASDNGLARVSRKQNPFKILQAGNSIRGIFRDEQGLWIGGYRQNAYENLAAEEAQITIPLYPAATSFVRGKQGHLWAGTDGFIMMVYIPDQNRWVEHDYSAQEKRLFKVFQNPVTGKLWVGTPDGLAYLGHKNEELISFQLPVSSKATFIRHFYQNEQGIWIASSKGLFLMDSRTEVILDHFSTADGLPNDNLNHLYEDAEGIFWLATKGGGLIRWDRQKNTFRQFTRENGLSDNTIYAVYEDDYENLWLPSNYGLMRFDKNSQDTRAYLPKNGIAHEEFNTFAHFQAEDGALYFGGLNGITQFHPKDVIGEEKENIPLYLAKVRVLTENAEDFLDKTEDFRAAKMIRLDPGARILELEVSLLDYESSADNQYAYQIEGYQDQWVYTGENKISIINPPYGRYAIKIKGRGASGAWSGEILSVPVYVKKPFYLQWPFIVMLSAFIIATAIGAVRWRVAKLKRDRVRLEAEVQKRTLTIQQQAEELKTLDKAKTRFFSNITHEFRTPLTLIIGPLEQVVADPALPSIFRRRIDGILKNARHLLTLINQMLDLSKIEGGSMKTEAARGDIITYTREIVSRFQALAKKKEQRLNFVTPLDHWETHFDKEKWDKILYNLLSNAIKFTAEGQAIQASLMKARKGQQEYIRLDVKDSGIGIEKEQLSQIFDRFYQADNSSTRAQGGTGIGLALVKELVELQGGEIRVSSEVGKGTVFEVYLPVLEGEQVQPLVAEPAPEPAPVPIVEAETPVPAAPVSVFSEQPKLELLLIEDNAEMREYIRYCIGPSRYHITEAADGEEGIEKALALVPDLIISDVMMPKKNGFEAVKAIRGHIGTSHIPLILLTAKASLESRLEGLRRGADAYLTKPFSPQELALRIEKLIEIRRLLQQRYQDGLPPSSDDAYRQEDEFIVNLREYILERIDEADLSGDRIGRHFGMSRTHLHRKLKALTDQPITDFVRSIRLQKALELIREDKLNVSEISYQTGFSSLSHFSRSFKKAYGKAPSEMKDPS